MFVRYWLFVFLTLLFTGAIGYNTWQTARVLRMWRPPGNPLLHPLETLLRVALIAVCVGLGLLSGLPWPVLGWQAPEPWVQVAWGLVAGTALALLFMAGTYWIVRRTGRRYYSPLVVELVAPRNGVELLLTALVMVTVVALEELLFRSLLVGGLTPLLPAEVLVVGFGVLFGLLHIPQGRWGMAGAGLAGIAFGWLFVLSGSLLLPMVAHYTANMVQLTGAMWLRRREGWLFGAKEQEDAEDGATG